MLLWLKLLVQASGPGSILPGIDTKSHHHYAFATSPRFKNSQYLQKHQHYQYFRFQHHGLCSGRVMKVSSW